MRKIAFAAALAALLGACGSPPPANVPPGSKAAPDARPVSSAAPSADAADPQTPDATFRYAPPDRAAPVAPLPTPIDFTLSNGQAVRFVEVRKSPVVTAVVVVKWRSLAKIPGTAAVFGAAFHRLVLPSGKSLMDELEGLGARAFATSDQDATYVRVTAVRDVAAEALTATISALRSGKLDVESFTKARERVIHDVEGESESARADRVADAQLFPASHRYHAPSTGAVEGLDKLKVDDVTRYRDAALAADGIAFGVAGAMSKDELSAALERAVNGWTAKASAKPAKPSAKADEVAPAGMAHGVFVTDRASGSRPLGIVVIPMPDGNKADFAAALVAWGVLVERAAQRLRDAAADGRSHLDSHMRPRMLGRTMTLFVTAESAPGRAVEHVLAAMDDVVKNDFPDSDVTYTRRARSIRATPMDGVESYLWFLADELRSGSPPGAELGLAPKIQAVPRDRIVAAAAAYFKRDRVSVVIDGGSRDEKDALEKLGAGPVKFVAAPKAASSTKGATK